MSSVTWAANRPPGCPNKKWLGFKTGSSREWAPSYANGLEFIKASTLIAVYTPVIGKSSIFNCCLQSFFSHLNQWLRHLTVIPAGGFQFYLISLLASLSAILSWLIAWTSSLISLFAPLKVCTIMACDFFRPFPSGLLAKRIHEYVVLNENAISKCTALVAEHVNRHKHITADILRVILLLKGSA